MDTQGLKLPWGRSLSRDDLDQMPHDGRRYELIDGLLVVSPAPSFSHQYAIGNLLIALKSACPRDLEVVVGPIGLALSNDTEIQPDLVVIDRKVPTDRGIPVAARLTIEVSSPSNRAYDLLLKKDLLQRAGCQHYWVIDPDVPHITAWTLHDGVYVEVANASGDQEFRVTEPYPINLIPSELITG